MRKKGFQFQNSLCSQINRTSRTIRKYFNQELMKRGYGLTGEQFEVLVFLWDNDGKNQKRLSKALCKDKTTITRLIKSLEKLNLIKRVKNKKDEREKLVYLTQSGKTIIKKFNYIAQKISMKAQIGIDPTDMAICKDVLRRVHETLSKEFN